MALVNLFSLVNIMLYFIHENISGFHGITCDTWCTSSFSTPDQAVVILMVLQMPMAMLQIPAVITLTDLLVCTSLLVDWTFYTIQ